MNASSGAVLSDAAVDHPIYTTEELAQEIRQTEILTGLTQFVYDPISGEVEAVSHDYAIIASQDCDLLRDYEAQQESSPLPLNEVLIYEANAATVAKSIVPSGKDIWRKIIGNNDARYHFLEKIPSSCDVVGKGIPALVVDFRRCFTVPHKEILRQCSLEEGAQRRCRLKMPYREHFQSRLAFFMQRVMLPEPHNTNIE